MQKSHHVQECKASTEKSTNADVKINTYETSLQKLQDEIEILKQQLNQEDKQCEKAQNATKQANVELVKYKEKAVELAKDIRNKNKRMKRLKRKIQESKEAFSFYDDYLNLNANVLIFFLMQINHNKRKKWSIEEKEFAMNLFYKSPKAYCYWRDQKKFALP